jgi:hypothetical protein
MECVTDEVDAAAIPALPRAAPRRPLRVLRVIDPAAWGDRLGPRGHACLESLRALSPSEHLVAAVALRPPRALLVRAASHGLRVRTLDRLPLDPRLVRDLIGLVEACRADVVHLDGRWPAACGRLAATLLGRPVLLERGQVLREVYAAAWQPLGGSGDADAADHAVVVADDALRAWGRPQPPERSTTWRLKLGIPLGARVIGCVLEGARSSELVRVLEAAYLLPAQYDIHVLLVGDPGGRPALRRRIDELAMAHRTHVLPSAADPAGALAVMDLIVLPRAAGIPGRVCAMLSARPTIWLAEPSAGPLLDHERTGWRLDRPSPKALARSINRLLVDSGLAGRLGAQARAGAQRCRVGGYIHRLRGWYDALRSSARGPQR